MTDTETRRGRGRPQVGPTGIYLRSMDRLLEQTNVSDDEGCWPTETKTLAWPMPFASQRRQSVTPRTFMWLTENHLPLPRAVRIVVTCGTKNCVQPKHLEAQHRWERETFAPLPPSGSLPHWSIWTPLSYAKQVQWIDIHNVLFQKDKRGYPFSNGAIPEWSIDQYKYFFLDEGEKIPMCGNAGW